MLFKYSFHEQIANGAITVTYRAWESARVRVGGRYRPNADGVVAVEEVREAPVARITDAAARPWTCATLALIDAHPRVAASRLAPHLGRATAPFKSNVRKLKALGLTVSHDTRS